MLPISITGLLSVLLSLSSVSATIDELTRPCKAKLAPERISADAIPVQSAENLRISAATFDEIRKDCGSPLSAGPGNDLNAPQTDEWLMKTLAAGVVAFRPGGDIADHARTGHFTQEDAEYMEAMGEVINTQENRHMRKVKAMVSKLDTESAKKWARRIILKTMDRVDAVARGVADVTVGVFKIIAALINVYTVSLGFTVMFCVLLGTLHVGVGGTIGLLTGGIFSLGVFVWAMLGGR